ncbi:MAG: M15 family metallopeptidase [Candidatus Paceibacterota bacterium]
MEDNKKIFFTFSLRPAFLTVFLLFLLGCSAYYYMTVSKELRTTKEEFQATNISLGKKITGLKEDAEKLKADLLKSQSENAILSGNLADEQNKNNLFETQIQTITGTVGALSKLSQTDKELLQKYSKVYFLNEHYVPPNLVLIDPQYVYQKNKPLQFHMNAYPYLVRMLEAATTTNPILLISAYRSFGEQASLKTNYLVTYGSGANRFSADQGYSEHQLGTTADLTTPKLGAGFTKFDGSAAYKWLTENAHRYGFILSYPKQNTYFQYEPWHWRYVGVDLATKLHDGNQFFYDIPQREIDSYLISIF